MRVGGWVINWVGGGQVGVVDEYGNHVCVRIGRWVGRQVRWGAGGHAGVCARVRVGGWVGG